MVWGADAAAGDAIDAECKEVRLKKGTREPASSVLGGAGPDRRVMCGSAQQDSQPSPTLYCHPHEVESRLSTSKPISWRGRGELPTYSWSALGTWLVIDLWSGIRGTLFEFSQWLLSRTRRQRSARPRVSRTSFPCSTLRTSEGLC